MFWQCSECGGLIDAAPRISVCPECGRASAQILPAEASGADLSELRDYWFSVGMGLERPLTDFARLGGGA